MIKTFAPLLLFLSLVGCVISSSRPIHTCRHQSENIEKQIGYCQAVRSGDLLFISGSVGKGEMPKAVEMAYKELSQTLKQNGLTFANVIKENVYATDLEAFKKTAGLRKEFYGNNLPAATWVEVKRLFDPSFVVEIELIAEFLSD